MREDPRAGTLGLRSRVAMSLVAVLALAAALALFAVRPLVSASLRAVRRRSAVSLTRAIAGQAMHERSEKLDALLADSIGPGALEGATVLDAAGLVASTAGTHHGTGLISTREDRVIETPERVSVIVSLPDGRTFIGDVSLAPGAPERSASLAMLLYTAMASGAALLVVYLALTRTIIRPIEQLTVTAERVAEGRRDQRPLPTSHGARELVRAAQAFNTMTAQLIAREKELSDRVVALEQTTRELASAQSQLVRSERLATVGRLSAGIAHEVGNPLAAIVGLADVVREGGLDEEEIKDFGTRIGTEAQRIHRTVRELLDYARSTPASAEENSSVADVVSHVRKLLEPQRAMRTVSWQLDIESPCIVAVGSDRMVQLILNLALNAGDALAEKSPAATPSIRIRAHKRETKITIDVEDNGAGIANELRTQVFEPFFTTRPAGQGTGLGLAMCAAIAEAAGGSIRVVDRPDGLQGACIRIELPAARFSAP